MLKNFLFGKMISTSNDKEISLLKLFHLNNLKKNSKMALEDCRRYEKNKFHRMFIVLAETEFIIGDLKNQRKT